MKKLLGYVPLAGGAVVLLGALAAQAQIIDDYTTSLSLSPYTLTSVNLGAGHSTSISLSDSSGKLVSTFTGANAVEQDVFLRSDISLPVGGSLIAKIAFPVTTNQMDFGIMVADTGTPTAAAPGGDVRNLFNWASLSIR